MNQTITSNWRPIFKSRISFSCKDQALAACARRDGRIMAVLLKVSPPRSNLKAFHRLFDILATKYSRVGISEFESAYYENIQ